jgi:pyroglutamyl-peptidase
MYKLALSFLLLSSGVHAEIAHVLVSSFDPFENGTVNNSNVIADEIKKTMTADVSITTCLLPTSYDLAYHKLKECYEAMPEKPTLVLGLGSGNCNLKIETMFENIDHNPKIPDNSGNLRRNSTIILNGQKKLGASYPIEEMFCQLPPELRNPIEISANAGSFVCNNTAYQFRYNFIEAMYGFIHVPNQGCRGNIQNIEMATKTISRMILTALKYESQDFPTNYRDINALLQNEQRRSCKHDFYKRTLKQIN